MESMRTVSSEQIRNSSLVHRFNIIFGDSSGDGHDRRDIHHYASNYPLDKISSSINKSIEEGWTNPTRLKDNSRNYLEFREIAPYVIWHSKHYNDNRTLFICPNSSFDWSDELKSLLFKERDFLSTLDLFKDSHLLIISASFNEYSFYYHINSLLNALLFNWMNEQFGNKYYIEINKDISIDILSFDLQNNIKDHIERTHLMYEAQIKNIIKQFFKDIFQDQIKIPDELLFQKVLQLSYDTCVDDAEEYIYFLASRNINSEFSDKLEIALLREPPANTLYDGILYEHYMD